MNFADLILFQEMVQNKNLLEEAIKEINKSGTCSQKRIDEIAITLKTRNEFFKNLEEARNIFKENSNLFISSSEIAALKSLSNFVKNHSTK